MGQQLVDQLNRQRVRLSLFFLGFLVVMASVMENPFRYYFMTPVSHRNSYRPVPRHITPRCHGQLANALLPQCGSSGFYETINPRRSQRPLQANCRTDYYVAQRAIMSAT
jgi:hypothetical protein